VDQKPTRGLALGPEQWHAVLAFLLDQSGLLVVRVAASHADGHGGLEAARWRSLQMARYDVELDELELTVASGQGATLRYLVSNPRLATTEEWPSERVLRVYDACGMETVIRVRERPAVCCSRDQGDGMAPCD
jgi:hypothetical protein